MITAVLTLLASTTVGQVQDLVPDEFPSGRTTYMTLREVNRGFLAGERGRDNWEGFVPLFDAAVKHQADAPTGVVMSVESEMVSRFAIYSFACEYDDDMAKAAFDGRLKCVELLSQFSLVRSDTNALFKLADWLSGAVPLAVDKNAEFAESSEAFEKDKLMIYGGGDPPRYPGSSGNTSHFGPAMRAHKSKFHFRRTYNERLPKFREAVLCSLRNALMECCKDLSDSGREAVWSELRRRAAGEVEDKCDGLLRAIASHPDDPGVERNLVEQFVALPYARLPASKADRAVDFSARMKCVEGIATLGVMRGDTNLLLSVCKHISELKPLPTDGREDDLSNARKLLLRLCHTQEEIDAFNNFKPDGKTMRGALLIHPEFCNLFDDIRNEYDARERYNAEVEAYKRKSLEILRPQANASGQTKGLLPMADAVGDLQLLPMDDYWKERAVADQEDEKDGYHSGISYPGHRRPASYSITNSRWRPDTSKFGPRLKACEEKWRPVIERNLEIGERRNAALRDLRVAIETRLKGLPDEAVAELLSNVVERAHLSPKEVDMVFPKEGGRQP